MSCMKTIAIKRLPSDPKGFILHSWTAVEAKLNSLRAKYPKATVHPLEHADYKLNRFFIGWKVQDVSLWINIRDLRKSYWNGEMKPKP